MGLDLRARQPDSSNTLTHTDNGDTGAGANTHAGACADPAAAARIAARVWR